MITFTEENIESWRETIRRSIPQLSINTVIFRFYNKELQFVVMRLIQGNKWLVPGGYVFQDESVDEAAKRNLYQQTQLDHLVLHQFASFGASGRQMGVDNSDIEQINMPKDIVDWITNRFVTIAYYSIIADPKTKIIIGELYDSAKWLNIDEVDGLAMDHSTIVMEARKALAKDLLSRPILLSFLPADFIMPDLQKLYEAIIGRTVDRGNFRKRMLKSGFLIKTGQVVDNAPQRPPELYILDKERYLNSLSEDVKLGF